MKVDRIDTSESKTILLTFDVEDWFQVENFKKCIPYSTWSSRELRVERNTRELLELLSDAPARVSATFFILGWIAERCPELVREIHQRGHEVASHGVDHHLCYSQTPDDLRRDLIRSKELLQGIIGDEIFGFRAPSFSVSDEIVNIVHETGYLYDSSYNSYEGHGRYGKLNLPHRAKRDLPFYTLRPSFYELPVSNLRFGNKVIPWGGGGYFRLLPAFLHRAGVRHILQRTGCYVFYMHPWEIDPEQPRVQEGDFSSRCRHYVNLATAKKKLEVFIEKNAGHSFLNCKEFISQEIL